MFSLLSIISLFAVVGSAAPLARPDPQFSPIGGGSGFGSSTQNGVTGAGATCKDVTLIFARGTSEPGNMGSVVGPPLAQALAQDVGSDGLAVQGVAYSASIQGAIEGGDPAGSTTMAQLVSQVAQKCPDSKIVMSGYSQGAQLVHNAAGQLDSGSASKVAVSQISYRLCS